MCGRQVQEKPQKLPIDPHQNLLMKFYPLAVALSSKPYTDYALNVATSTLNAEAFDHDSQSTVCAPGSSVQLGRPWNSHLLTCFEGPLWVAYRRFFNYMVHKPA